MAFFMFLPPIVRVIITTAVGAKLASFVTSWVTSPTNHGMRDSFLDHLDNVFVGLDKAQIGIGPSDRVSLTEDIELLRHFALPGWTHPYETAALGRVLLFLSWAHAKGIGQGVGNAASSHSKAAGDWVWKKGGEALDAIFPPQK